MSSERDLDARVTALEQRMEHVAGDAAAARHLAAARDRDLGELTAKVDANRRVMSALGEQTRARFDAVDRRIDTLEGKVDDGFAGVRGRLDGLAAGQEVMVQMLTTLIDRDGGEIRE